MQTLYDYNITGEDLPQNFEEIVESSISLKLSLFSTDKIVTIYFVYDPDNKLIHTERFEGIDEPLFTNPPSPDQLKELMKESNSIITIRSKEDYPIGRVVIKLKDYSQMITDLEEASFVITKPSKLFLATDPRIFKFQKKLSITEDPDQIVQEDLTQEWNVDCLGTNLCMDITDVVERIWMTLKTKSID